MQKATDTFPWVSTSYLYTHMSVIVQNAFKTPCGHLQRHFERDTVEVFGSGVSCIQGRELTRADSRASVESHEKSGGHKKVPG